MSPTNTQNPAIPARVELRAKVDLCIDGLIHPAGSIVTVPVRQAAELELDGHAEPVRSW